MSDRPIVLGSPNTNPNDMPTRLLNPDGCRPLIMVSGDREWSVVTGDFTQTIA